MGRDPELQGRGVASSATAQLIERARAEQQHRFVHAYLSVANAPSNAICRKLGFTLLGEIDFPARRGGTLRCNDWRFDLFTDGRPRSPSAERGASNRSVLEEMFAGRGACALSQRPPREASTRDLPNRGAPRP